MMGKVKKYVPVFAIVFVVMLSACISKVIDPADPRFDVSKFRFEDYTSIKSHAEFKKMFPVGTDKAFVDNILVKIGGAKPLDRSNHKTLYTYSVPSKPFSWTTFVEVTYNRENKVTKVWVNSESSAF